MILAIDSGNTASKIGIITDGKLDKIIEKKSYSDLILTLKSLNPEQIVLGTVKFPADHFQRDLPDISLFNITHQTPLPFKLFYKTPQTLGIDRIAATAGAWEYFPAANLLIIDTGTCITYDFISGDGHYQGGGISPGPELRFRSLHEFTTGLPLVEFRENAELIGNSTENSIASGIINGTVAEIEGIIERYRLEYPDIKTVLCGGYAKFFETKLKDPIFAIPDLVLLGLFSIFRYNV